MGQHRKFTNFSLLEEATAGTTPASAMQLVSVAGMPAFKRDRTTGAPDFVTSGDRTPYPQEIFVDEGSLSIPASPLVYRNLIQPIEGIYASDEVTVAAISETDISVTSDVMSSVGGTAFTNLAVGDCFHIAFGGGGPTDGIYGPLQAAAAGSITFPAGQIADYTAGSTQVHKTFNRLTDGEVFKTYSAEWEATKLTTYFENAVYMTPNSYEMSWSAGGGFATETVTFRGKKPTKAAATIGTGAATAAPTSSAMSASQRFGTLVIGEVATNLVASAVISELTFGITNDNGFGPGLGTTDFQVAVLGDIVTTLKATMVLDDVTAAIVDEFEDLDTLWTRFDMTDAQGNRIVYFNSAMKPTDRDKGDSNNILNQSIDLVGHDPLKSSGDTHNITGMPMTSVFFIAA